MINRKRILVALLALGTIGGFGAGFASMKCRGQHGRAAFERRVAQVCVDAARASDQQARAVSREQSERRGEAEGRAKDLNGSTMR